MTPRLGSQVRPYSLYSAIACLRENKRVGLATLISDQILFIFVHATPNPMTENSRGGARLYGSLPIFIYFCPGYYYCRKLRLSTVPSRETNVPSARIS